MSQATTLDAPPRLLLTSAQQATLDHVLNFGGDRPTARPGLVEDLRHRILDGTRAALETWSSGSLFLSKAQLGNVIRCEGLYKHSKDQPRTAGLLPAVAQGTVIHRTIQHCHTHPHLPVEHNVRTAIDASIANDTDFSNFWANLGTAGQSDLTVSVTSAVMTFLDSWPPIASSWSPRFEFGIQARVGALTLSGRTDLILGRPRADAKQSMVVVDWKSGNLYPEHELEASFYALLATLRFQIPPYRSFIYSLASGETTNMDVDEDRLYQAADAVIAATTSITEVMEQRRLPVLNPTGACSWCPGRAGCPAVGQSGSATVSQGED